MPVAAWDVWAIRCTVPSSLDVKLGLIWMLSCPDADDDCCDDNQCDDYAQWELDGGFAFAGRFFAFCYGESLKLGNEEILEMNIHSHAREIKMECSLSREDKLFFRFFWKY